MTDRELMQQALDALEVEHSAIYGTSQTEKAIEALRARLAQPEQDDGYCQACEGNRCTAKDGCVALDNPRAQPKQEELGEIVPADEEQLKRIAKLVEPEQEPVAWMVVNGEGKIEQTSHYKPECERWLKYDATRRLVPLYTAPPQREWQGLTQEDKREIIDETETEDRGYVMALVEAKLKGKNIG